MVRFLMLMLTLLTRKNAYYLKQNDVVYVQPNKVRAGESNLNENSMKSIGIWISIASLLTTVATLVVAAKK